MEASQSRMITIPVGYDANARILIGEDILRRIRTRTQSGIDVNGNLFAGYAKTYDKVGTVNLRLSGNMISDLVILSHGPGFIRIGFEDQESNDKAAWNQSPRGTKRLSAARQFVGINQADLNSILENYPL